MSDIDARIKLRDESIKRMKQINFGDPVTNICAGERNPMVHCYFVRYKAATKVAQCTDKSNKFWDIDIKVIYPGHLDKSARQELFQPVWDSEYK